MQIPKDIRMPEEHQSLWIPGLGTVPTAVLEARRAVRDYDPDLDLGKDERVGQWVVVIRNGPHEGRPFPVLGLGYELPPYDEIQRRLYQGDVRKRGYAIVQEIERKNEAVRKDLRDKAHDEAGEIAEAIDAFYHIKRRHPNPRIFTHIPGKE